MARSLLFILSLLVLARCATVTAPAGGPRDETPPQLVPERSTPNLQTNFQKQRIELTFDEWVALEDIFNQVVVSPPLQYRPTITLKGRTVRLDFDSREILRENATYTINFGEAVKDLTEKNPAENLRFVFSTGPTLDSLSLSGRVVDAKTGEPVEKILFMLYNDPADSVVRTERPFYFAKTDKEGNFLIENVRAGIFKGFALKDVDFNYRFNLTNEQIGFPDSLIVISDSTPALQIRLFEEDRPLRLLAEDARGYGRIKLTFNQPPSKLSLDYQSIGQKMLYEYDKDTLNVWYDAPAAQDWAFYLRQDTVLNDTVQVPALAKTDFLQNAKLVQTNRRQGQTFLNPDKLILLRFNHPIARLDASLIRLEEILNDTTRTPIVPDIAVDSLTPRVVWLRYPWREGLVYELKAMPGAFQDIFGLTSDTLQSGYRIELRKAFANLTLVLDNLQADTNYVVQLLQAENPVEEFQVSGVSTVKKQFKTLPPGDYSVKIIVDLNKNGRWDSGSYNLQRQPEIIITRKLETLRANWEVESTISL